MDGNKWWAWKDSNLRPADYVALRFKRGLSPVFVIREKGAGILNQLIEEDVLDESVLT